MRICTLFLLCSLFTLNSLAQDGKTIKKFNQAREYVNEQRYDKAKDKLRDILDDYPTYVEARVLLGQLYLESGDTTAGGKLYREGRKYETPPYYYYLFGLALFDAAHYSAAESALRQYLTFGNLSEKYREKAALNLESAIFARKAQLNQQAEMPQNLGEAVNTDQMDYFPSISADGRRLVFTHRSLEGPKLDEDFWMTEREADSADWRQSAEMQGFLNTPQNEGAQSLTADGRALFFAAYERPDGKGSCDLYVSFYQGQGRWGAAINLGDSINTAYWETQPSISSDGKTLYFVRAASGIAQNSDIYYAQLRPDGGFGRARPLPGDVNTTQQEQTPFIHFDNQTLYFSSKGHPGMGKFDFFVARRQADGSWGAVENLGTPINSAGDEFGLIVGPDGQTAYYASEVGEVNYGKTDLYSYRLSPAQQASPIAYVQGVVRDSKTKEVLKAKLDFVNLASPEEHIEVYTDRQGYFFAVLPANEDYALSIEKKGYLFYSKSFALAENKMEKAQELNPELDPISSGLSVRLENVFFETDSFRLDPKSRAELQNVAAFLKLNPTIHIELAGHTDNVGSAVYNKNLSQKRAEAVRQYLVNSGITPDRMTAVGYGQSQPIAPNDTESSRAQNRRTEMRIVRP